MTEATIIAAFIGGGLIYHSLKAHHLRRRIEDVPTSRIATAPQGLVEVQGYAWPLKSKYGKDEIQYTLEGKSAVYHKLVIEEKKGSAKNSRWVEVHSEEHASPFLIFDESGAAMVIPLKADLQIYKQTRSWGSLDDNARMALNGLIPSGGVLVNLFRQYRVIESYILVGSPVYALGTFRTAVREAVVSPAEGYQEFRRKLGRALASVHRLSSNHLRGSARDIASSFHQAAKSAQLAIARGIEPSNSSHSSIAPPPWPPGGTHPHTSGTAALKKPAFVPEPQLLPAGTIAHETSHPLVLADCHQTHLIARFGLLNQLKMLGGAVLIALAVVDFIFNFTGK
jgi:hypothetical protein